MRSKPCVEQTQQIGSRVEAFVKKELASGCRPSIHHLSRSKLVSRVVHLSAGSPCAPNCTNDVGLGIGVLYG